MAVLLSFMFMYQVRYDEVAVLTTFEKATAQSIKREPGLYLRWPAPIQRVTPYSTLLQVLEPPEGQITLDGGASVVVRPYMTWKIDDPLAFYTSLQTLDKAREQLTPMLRTQINGALGRCRFEDIVNARGDQRLQQAEKEALDGMRAELDAQKSQTNFGVKVIQVGIRRLVLPEASTTEVFRTMEQTRKTLAESARAEGRSKAREIEDKAESMRASILAFADGRASQIVARGQADAAKYVAEFEKAPELAMTLSMIEAQKKAFGAKGTTFIFSSDDLNRWVFNGTPLPEPKK